MAEDTRPLCKCHSEPMVKNAKQRDGRQKWACGRKRRRYGTETYWNRGGRERKSAAYQDRFAREVCVRCEGPLTTRSLCWDCLSELEARRALYV